MFVNKHFVYLMIQQKQQQQKVCSLCLFMPWFVILAKENIDIISTIHFIDSMEVNEESIRILKCLCQQIIQHRHRQFHFNSLTLTFTCLASVVISTLSRWIEKKNECEIDSSKSR